MPAMAGPGVNFVSKYQHHTICNKRIIAESGVVYPLSYLTIVVNTIFALVVPGSEHFRI
jgi:hypothetical protein